MARYALGTQNGGTPQAMTTTFKTLAAITSSTGASTLRRGWIYDVSVGTDGTPADNAMTYQIDRQTTLGTGTTGSTPLDSSDAVALLVCTNNYTVEPTITASTAMWTLGVNQRASYRLVLAPGGEFIVPATNVNGIGLRAKSPAYTGTATGSMNFWE